MLGWLLYIVGRLSLLLAASIVWTSATRRDTFAPLRG